MATKVTYTSTTLGDEAADAAFDAAVEQARADVAEHQLVIDGQRRPGGSGTFDVQNPAQHSERLGTFAEASADDVADAVRVARDFAPTWRQTPGAERVRIVRAAAEAIRERVMYLSAVVALEVGKNRVESVGEVQEAADLIASTRASSRSTRSTSSACGGVGPRDEHVDPAALRRVRRHRAVQLPERSLRRAGRGRARLRQHGRLQARRDHAVVGRPAGRAHAPGGRPRRALQLVTGGPEAGEALAARRASTASSSPARTRSARSRAHFGTAGVRAALHQEMGGKNPAIVTANADLDRAAEGIARSAFGASGQKCSACSRVSWTQRCTTTARAPAARGRAVTLGDPLARAACLGPVIDAGARRDAIEQAVEEARRDGRVVTGGGLRAGARGGWSVEPTVVAACPPATGCSRDELFVPFLAVERGRSLDEALAPPTTATTA